MLRRYQIHIHEHVQSLCPPTGVSLSVAPAPPTSSHMFEHLGQPLVRADTGTLPPRPWDCCSAPLERRRSSPALGARPLSSLVLSVVRLSSCCSWATALPIVACRVVRHVLVGRDPPGVALRRPASAAGSCTGGAIRFIMNKVLIAISNSAIICSEGLIIALLGTISFRTRFQEIISRKSHIRICHFRIERLTTRSPGNVPMSKHHPNREILEI